MSWKRASELTQDRGYELLTDSQDVAAVFESLNFKNTKYLSVMEKVGEGEFLEVWASSKQFPNNDTIYWEIDISKWRG